MTTVTMKAAVEAFQRGEKVHVVELRASKAETINYRDKKTGLAASFTQIRHSVELGDSIAVVGERVPDNFKPDDYKQVIPKGTKCLLRYTSSIPDKGVEHFSGTLQAISA